MTPDHFIFAIFVIFTGAAVLSTLVLLTKQSTIVAYMLLGLVIGPFGFKLVADPRLLGHIGQVGIIFLFFLVGLDLNPRDLWNSLQKVTFVTLGVSFLVATIGYGFASLAGFNQTDAIVIAATMTFSSTIISLKLMPSEMLRKQHIGDLMVSILLLQDLLAIFALLFFQAVRAEGGLDWRDGMVALVALPTLLIFTFLVEQWILMPLIRRFGHIKEYIFLLAIGWCLGIAQLGNKIGLSDGIGAFIAGVSIANNSPIAIHISQRLKPLRDFFLVLFFFYVGAMFNFRLLPDLLLPSLLLVVVVVLFKPWLFAFFLRMKAEKKVIANQVGFRLGQASEFSILLASIAADISPQLISLKAKNVIIAMTILSFVISCYYVAWRYETPISSEETPR